MEQRAQQKKTLIQGLTAMFPSVRSFVEFEQDDREISGKAIPYIFQAAYDAGLIQNASREAFIEWLPTIWSGDCTPAPEGVTFGEVLDELTGSNSVNMLLEQVNKIAERFHLPTIQAPMVTRLKQDFHLNSAKKRGMIRLLAFRCGEKYPELGWQYERLRQLPRTTAPNIALARETEGVVLEVAVQGRRTLLPPEAMEWLKHELAACIHDLGLSEYLTRRQISRSSATSVLLRIPRKPGFEMVGEPRLYTQAIRDSLALAHQMTLRWLLSAYSSVHNVLLIGIYAGPFREAQIDLHPLLDQHHVSNAPAIVLTDFAYLCARVAQVKVGFEPFLNTSNFWRVTYFWTYTYYTVGGCRQILCWLEECRDEAQRLIAKQLGVYAVTSTFVSYQTQAFLECVADALNLVTSSLSTLEWEQDDEALLDTATCAAISSVKLMFLHLDRPHETGAIVRKTSL